MRVKDAMLWSMLNDGRAKEAAQAESSRRLEEARVAVQTVERGSRDELQQWGALAEESNPNHGRGVPNPNPIPNPNPNPNPNQAR